MKTIFKRLGAGILTTGFIAVAGINAFAQDAPAADVCKEIEAQQALYKVFTDNIPPTAKKPTTEQTETAIKAGDDYVQKYGACPESKQIVDYFNANLPKMKDAVAKAKSSAVKGEALGKFDAAAKGKNVADVFSSGKALLAKESDFQDVALDVNLAMVSAGFDQAIAATPVDTYNADTITYAKSAIQKLESGKTSTNYGVWSYNFKLAPTETMYKDNKAYTLGALNYIIGNIEYYRQGKTDPAKKKEALQYLYKSTQYDSFTKNDPSIYQAIGAWYLDEAIAIDKKRQAILAAMPEKDRKDTPETLAMVGMQKGYADRAIDAYARAYTLAKASKTAKVGYADGLYTTLKEIYAFRFDNNTSGVDQYVASVQTKPLPDPTTEITPVAVEPTPTETTTTPTTNTTTPPATDTTKPATTPATDTTTKPATSPSPKPATSPTTPAKKPVSSTDATTPKKKGTR